MVALYTSKLPWGMEEEDDIPFTYWKSVDEYQVAVYLTLLPSNFVAVLPEV